MIDAVARKNISAIRLKHPEKNNLLQSYLHEQAPYPSYHACVTRQYADE